MRSGAIDSWLGNSKRRAAIETVCFLVPLIVLCGFVFFYHLGVAALFEPDEGRNADKARDILLLNDWVTPYTNFVPALDKPIFFSWLGAISYKILGVSDFSARFPSAVAGLACLLIAYFFGKRFLGAGAARWGSLVLCSSVEYLLLSRIVIFDMPLTLAVTISLCAFYWANRTENTTQKRLLYASMYAGAGVGMLIKGPIGLVLPGMVILAYIVITKKWRVLREMNLVGGVVLVLVIAAPWYLWCEIKNPGYLRYFLWEENVVRYFTPHFNRGEPWYYFGAVLLVGFIPWTLFIPLVLGEARKKLRDDTTLFLLLWTGLPLLFFSLSSAKLPQYILPIYPALALLTGSTVANILRDPSGSRRWWLSVPWLTLVVLLIPCVIVLHWQGLIPASGRAAFEEVARTIPQGLVGVTLLAQIVVAWASVQRWWRDWAFPVSCLALLLFVCVMVQTMTAVSPIRSSKELAERSASLIKPEDQVAFYDTYLSSLPFYLGINRPIWLVLSGKKSSIMGSIYIAEQNPQPAAGHGSVLLTYDQFAKYWSESATPIRVFIEKKHLPKLVQQIRGSPKILLDTEGFLLVSNR